MDSMVRRIGAIFVDQDTRQWVVRDLEGKFWVVPAGEDGWNRRRPFQMEESSKLSPVPGHYKYLLQIPF